MSSWVIVSFSDRVELSAQVMVRFLEKESVFLNLETERYYGLDETGTRIWQVVTAAPSIESAYAELLSEFDVEAWLLRQNLSELLGRLIDIGLLRVRVTDAEADSTIWRAGAPDAGTVPARFCLVASDFDHCAMGADFAKPKRHSSISFLLRTDRRILTHRHVPL